ncbi:hypothetical protein H6F78_04385 [Coleofasciculus sp. FACHB-64]|nr:MULTISPECIES: hypothetical protein [unclassified Coleofasciculus]MBD1837239.1 hypothetical protein [Coleofasciculus sp. FACHB-501]MBD1882344.1 hypothetical protein [Coleofasciculus sp. FACHB-T130]MBD1890183.1 hypothetical protein [Coleofasciculus sp. FACHB-SPT9]MBD1898067.1 hypothetical protein [Coleofasciculus sp. FACHB-129]MBD1899092.1 hypothetical protein [Coleofasciculus sp. FACHB-125]
MNRTEMGMLPRFCAIFRRKRYAIASLVKESIYKEHKLSYRGQRIALS